MVEENRNEGAESSDDEEDEAEFSLGSEDSDEDSELDLSLFVEIVETREVLAYTKDIIGLQGEPSKLRDDFK